MSIVERTIAIIFEGDDRSASAFGSVSSSIGSFTNTIEGAAGKIAGIADGVIKMDLALAALAAGGLTYAIAKSGEFNQATAEVGTLVSDTTFDMGAYRNSILDYAQTSTQSIGSITSALYSAISAGASWEDSIRAVAVAEQLAVAGKADLQDSTILLLSTLNAYGAGMDEASRYSDVFFQTVKLGQTTLPELVQSLSSVTSIAAAAGVPIETVAAAVADLTAKGMPTAEAITALRAAISSIIDPGTAAAKTAADLGIEFSASALASKGLEGVLQEVYTATGGNVEKMAELFGNVRGLTGVLAMFGQDGGDAFLAKLAQMRDAGGSVSVAYALMVNEIDNQNQRLVNSMQTTFIKVGQPLLDEYGDLVGALANLFKGLNIGLDAGAFDDVFITLQKFGTELANYIDGIAKALPEALDQVDFAGFSAALQKLADSFKGFLGGLDLTKPDDLARALQTVEQVITGLVNVTASMVDTFRPYVEQVALFFIELSKGDEEAQQFAGSLLAYAKVISMAGLEVALALTAMSETGTKWADVFEQVGAGLSYLWESISITIKAGMLAIVDSAIMVNDILDKLTLGQISFFQESNEWLNSLGDSLREGLSQDLLEAGRAFDTMTGGALQMEDSVNQSVGAVLGFGKAVVEAGAHAGDTAQEIDGLGRSLDGLNANTEFQMSIGGVEGVIEMVKQAGWELDQIPEETITKLAASPDSASFYTTWQELETAFADERDVSVGATADAPSVGATSNYLDLWLPRDRETKARAEADAASVANTSKQLDAMATDRNVKVSLDAKEAEYRMELLKQQFGLMQSNVEWKAKLDIAEVEANAQIVAALAGTMGEAFASSAQIISSAIDALSKLESGFDLYGERAFLEGVIERELNLRERAMAATEALVQRQIDFMEAKIRQMASGEAMVTIDGAGLQPHLEAFMWEILSAIQTRVNEEGHAMLFGI